MVAAHPHRTLIASHPLRCLPFDHPDPQGAPAWSSRPQAREFTSGGRTCASPLSDGCWPRRPQRAKLKAATTVLSQHTWQHPTTGQPVRFGFSTIERWYYRALRERTDPVGVLRRKVRGNAGQQHAVSDAVRRAVLAQYAAHKGWSVQLHHDNLVALAETATQSQAGAVLSDAAPFHEGQRPRQAPASHAAHDRRRRASRGPPRRPRDQELRGRVCECPLALGLPPWLAQGAHANAARG